MSEKRSYWLKSGLLTISDRFSALIFALGSVFILLRLLPREDFGTWALYLGIISFVEVARHGLIANALIKFMAGYKIEDKDYAEISTASLVLNGILSILSAIVLLGIAYPVSVGFKAPTLMYMLMLYSIGTIVFAPLLHFNAIQQANFNFKGTFWSNFVKQGTFFFFVCGVFFLNFSANLIVLVIVRILCGGLAAIVSWYFAKPYIRFSKTISREWIKKLFDFGKYVFGTNLSTMLYKNIDKFMIGGMLGRASVALYEVAIKITNLAEVPTFSIASIVFPKSAQKMNEEGRPAIKRLYEKSVGIIYAVLFPFILGVILFPELIITIVAGEEYLDAVSLLRWTMLYGLFIPFAVQFGTALDSMGKPKVNFYLTFIGMGINVISNYLFITNFGVIGAAYGTLLTYLISFGIMQTILFRELKVQFYNAFGYMFKFYWEGFLFVQAYLNKNKTSAGIAPVSVDNSIESSSNT